MKARTIASTALASAAFLLWISSDADADTKLRVRYDVAGQSSETTIYSQGQRQRFEHGSDVAVISQCDQGRIIQLLHADRMYMTQPLTAGDAGGQAPVKRRGGVVTYTTTVTDTGERRELFGMPARRLRAVMETQPGPGACSSSRQRVETDGWYLDFDPQISCDDESPGAAPMEMTEGDCVDEVRHRYVGEARLGYAVHYTMKMLGKDGKPAHTMSVETVELSTSPLDPALFDIPAGYSELSAWGGMTSTAGGALHGASGPVSFVPPTPAPKQAGAVRIGVAVVGNNTTRPFQARQFQDQIVDELRQDGFDAVLLGTGSPDEVRAMAQRFQCDHVLWSDIAETTKQTAGKLGGIMGALGGGGGAPRDKHEARVDFRLTSAASDTPLLTSSSTGKTGGMTAKGALSLASTLGGAGMMSGMMNLNPESMGLMSMFQGGGFGSLLGQFDPGMGAMSSMMQRFGGMGGAPQIPKADPEEIEAVGEAFQKAAKAVSAQLKGSKVKKKRA